LPDFSANIMHMADQYAAANKQREASKAAKAAADAKRQEEYYKLVDEKFDPSKQNGTDPYNQVTTERIAEMNKKYNQILSEAGKKGLAVDEGQLRAAMTQDFTKVKTTADIAKLKDKEIEESVKALAIEKGIDHDKLLGLAKTEYFNSVDETGKRVTNPDKWNKNMTGADVVKKTLEKYAGVLSTNEGVQEDLMANMQKQQPAEYKTPGKLDANGQAVIPSYDLKIKPFQEVVYDNNGLPNKLDIRQQPVIKPNGDPLLNPDGTERKTIAKDLEEQAMSHLGFAMAVKKELHEAMGEENQRRQAINENLKKQGLPPTLQMVTGESEEAKVMRSDIVLERYRNAMQGGGIDVKENKDFENRMRAEALKISKSRLSIAQQKEARDRKKFADDQAADDIESPLVTIARKQGVKSATPAGEQFLSGGTLPKERTIVYKDEIDVKDLNLMRGAQQKFDSYGKAIKLEEPEPFVTKEVKGESGTTPGREYYIVDEETGDFIGKKGRFDSETTRNRAIKEYDKADLPKTSYANPKAKPAEAPARQTVVQKGIAAVKAGYNKAKAAVTPKKAEGKKIKGTKEKLF